jgi:hypothetical protein
MSAQFQLCMQRNTTLEETIGTMKREHIDQLKDIKTNQEIHVKDLRMQHDLHLRDQTLTHDRELKDLHGRYDHDFRDQRLHYEQQLKQLQIAGEQRERQVLAQAEQHEILCKRLRSEVEDQKAEKNGVQSQLEQAHNTVALVRRAEEEARKKIDQLHFKIK